MKHPASSPDLAFTINPGTVYISTKAGQYSYADLAVTVTNNSADTLTVKGVTITLPDTLAPTSTLKSIIPTAAQANLWNFHPSPINDSEFDATPASGSTVTLKSGDTWNFTLKNVTLVNTITQTPANVIAAIYFSDNTNTSQNLPVNIAVAAVGIDSFTADLPDITPGQTSTLQWQCKGTIDYCLLIPGDGHQFSGQDSTRVEPEESITYTLYAYGSGAIISAQFTITVENPRIIAFSAVEGEERVDLNSNVILQWRCNEFTDSIEIVANTSVNIPALTNPQNGSVPVGPMTAPTTFTLRAFAKDKTIYTTETAAVGINDVTVALTVTPTTNLWVQDEITLNWDVTNATEVAFSPEIPEGPSLQKLSGSATYSPPAGVTSLPLKLTAKGFVDDLKKTVTNQPPIVLEFQTVTITDFSISPAVISNSSNSNEAILSWNTQAQNVSIDKLGTVKPIDNKILDSPANGDVYTLSAGTLEHPAMMTKQVQVVNANGPFTYNSFFRIQAAPSYCGIPVAELAEVEQYINQPCTIIITGLAVDGKPVTQPITAHIGRSSNLISFIFDDIGNISPDHNQPLRSVTVIG